MCLLIYCHLKNINILDDKALEREYQHINWPDSVDNWFSESINEDEKGLGNVTHPSSGIGGIGMVPFNKLFPNSIIIKEYQKTKIN